MTSTTKTNNMTGKQKFIVALLAIGAFIGGMVVGVNFGYAKGHSAGVTETQQQYNPNAGN